MASPSIDVNQGEVAVIVLPLPPRCLSPNCPIASKRGRIMRAMASKKQKQLAIDAVRALCIDEPWERATVRVVYYHKTQRRRDDVNHLAMLKSAYDGCVEGGLIIDDDSTHLTTLGCEFKLDKKDPRVELIYTRVVVE